MARSLMACLRWTETNRFGWKLKLNRIDFFFKLVKEKKVYYFIKIIWWIISIKTVELFRLIELIFSWIFLFEFLFSKIPV